MDGILLKRTAVVVKGWSEEEDKILEELWKDRSISASKIGEKLSRSKNSVIGRTRRLGLPIRMDGRSHKPRERVRMDKATVRRPRPEEPDLFAEKFQALGVPLLEAEAHHCRAIVDKDEQGLAVFCGHYVPPDRRLSFCRYHLQDYTVAPRPRVR